MKKGSIIAILTALLTLAAVSVVFAAGSQCQIVYGGGEVCEEKIQFTLDKKVQSPTKSGEFVDNFTINDARFQPGATVAFKIQIKNTGDKAIEKLDVVDSLPEHLSFLSGAGNFNRDNNTVSYTISNLEPGKTHEQTIVASIASVDTLPSNQGIICQTNEAEATDNSGNVANDTAGLCIQKEIQQPQPEVVQKKGGPQVFEQPPVKKIPETGPEMLSLLALIPVGLAGMKLRNKSKFK